MSDDKIEGMKKKDGLKFSEEGDREETGYGISDNFGMLLKHYREIRNFTLKELEDISGVSASYIFRLERGDRTAPGLPKLMALCDALDIPYYQVLATVFKESASKNDALQTVQEVLIANDFLVNGEPINREAKEQLIKIIGHVIACDWSPSAQMREMYMLSELINQFKTAL